MQPEPHGRLKVAGRRVRARSDLSAAIALMERVCVLLHVEEGGTEEAARETALVMPVFERWKDSTR
jgi:hypothetical protein